jgi:signal recognition particle subunit SRP54
MAEQVRLDDFTLDNFRDQLRAMRTMGPVEQLLGMLPGAGALKSLGGAKPDEKQLAQVAAMIDSMTPHERRNHEVIKGSRRKRIARGSGTKVEDVNRLLSSSWAGVQALGGAAGRQNRRRALQMLSSRMS